ncbi:MAG: hypothetical protein WDZ45_07740 [Flavobacteriaceae bacterium]
MSTIYMDIQNISPKMEMFDYENIVAKFATSEGVKEQDKTKYFKQQWMPFAWAATLGFIEGVSKPLEGDLKKETFKYTTINNNGERIFQSLILFAVAKKGHEILQDVTELNKTIEEFANGGFEIIHGKISSNPDYFNHPNDYINFLLDSLDN